MKPVIIKIENKRQFDAVVKHMKSKGWSEIKEGDAVYGEYIEYIHYTDRFTWQSNLWNKDCLEEYEAISFDVFSLMTGVKLVEAIDIDYYGTHSVTITKDIVKYKIDGKIIAVFKRIEIEEIYTALKSLQDA